MEEPIWKDFQGHTIDLTKVCAVSNIKTYSTGSMVCNWEYGFDIKLSNSTLTIECSRPYRGASKQEYKKKVKDIRNDFIKILKNVER